MSDKTKKISIELELKGGRLVQKQINSNSKAMKRLAGETARTHRVEQGVAATSSNMTKEFSKMSQGIGGLVHVYAIFAANIFAVSAAFRALSEAANYDRMIAASEQLSIKTGISYANVAKGMKEVSAGALDMKTAMQTANLGIAAGFSGTQMKNITKLATQAGIALGRSVPDAINRLSLAIIKGEPELTDELGIILRLKKATEDYAKAHGKTAKELTAFERSQAVYAQAMKRGGFKYGEVDVMAQSFETLESSVSDFSKTLLSFVSTVLSPFVTMLSESKILMGVFAAILGTKLLKSGFNVFSQDSVERVAALNKHMTVFANKRTAIDNLNEKNKIDRLDTLPNLLKGRREASATVKEFLPRKLVDEFEKAGRRAGSAFSKGELDAFKDNIKQKEKWLAAEYKAGRKPDAYEREVAIPYKGNKHMVDIDEALIIREAQKEYDNATASVKEYNNERIEGTKKVTELERQRIADIRKNAKVFGASYASQGMTFAQMRKEAKKVTAEMGKTNAIIKMNARNTMTWGYLTERVTNFTAKLVGVVSTISTYLMVFTLMFVAISAIGRATGLWTGEMAKANSMLDDIKESGESLSKTMNEVFSDPKTTYEFGENFTKIHNILVTAKDDLLNILKAARTVAKAGAWEQIKDKVKSAFNLETTEGRIQEELEAQQRRDAVLAATSFSETYIDTVKEKLLKQGKKPIEFEITIKDPAKKIEDIDKQIKSLSRGYTALINNFTSIASIDKALSSTNIDDSFRQNLESARALLVVKNLILDRTEKNAKVTSKVTRYATTLNELLGINSNLLEDMLTGENERLVLYEKRAELLGDEEISSQAIFALDQQIVRVHNEWEAAAQNIANVMSTIKTLTTEILAQFGQFAGLTDAVLIDKLIKQQEALSNIRIDQGDSFPASVAARKEELRLEKRIGELMKVTGLRNARRHAAALREGEDSYKKVMGINEKHSGTQKQINKELTKQQNIMSKSVEKSMRLNVAYKEMLETGIKKTDQAAIEARAEIASADAVKERARARLGELIRLKAYEKETKKKGGSKGAKVTKVQGREAQIALEKLKQVQAIYSAVQKAEGSSMKKRYEASKNLYDLELAMHELRLGVIEGNKEDAKTNIKAAIAKGDAEKQSKAELALQKAITAEAVERAGHYERTYQIAKKTHEDQKNMFKEDFPDLKTFSAVLYKDIQQAAKELRDALMDPVSMLTKALVDVFKTGADSIAEAIVDNDWSSVKENIAESLRGSAKNMISTGIQGILASFVPIGMLGVGSDTDQLSAQNTTNKILNEILKEQQKAAIAGMFSGGGSDSFGFIEQFFASIGAKLFMAKGGVLDHVGQYAGGHIATRPELAVIGEGKNNEAVVPLPDNKSIPVTLKGSSGNTNSTVNVVINSDGSSSTSSENDGQQAKALGELINKTVQSIIVEERRIGGLLGA